MEEDGDDGAILFHVLFTEKEYLCFTGGTENGQKNVQKKNVTYGIGGGTGDLPHAGNSGIQ